MHEHNEHQHEIEEYEISALIQCFIVFVTVLGLQLSGSLLLASEAAHTFFDLGIFLVAIAVELKAKIDYQQKQRLRALGGLINLIMLVLLLVGILIECIARILHPVAVEPSKMVVAALICLPVNSYQCFRLHRLHRCDSNNPALMSVLIHIFMDIGINLSVIIGGVAIMLQSNYSLDIYLTLAVCAMMILYIYDLAIRISHQLKH